MKRLVRSLYVFAALLALTVAAPADIKVKTKNTMAGRSSESTVYIKGARQRDENPQMPFATILQCDKQRMLQVNDKCKVYMVTPLAEEEAAAPGKGKPAAQPAKPTTQGGVVTYTMAGLIGEIRSGAIDPSETVVFLHTGGSPALFAHAERLATLGS